MKDNAQVIREFNDIVNMTASELEHWLKSDDSRSAGWPKDDSSGESVGHDSGRKIVEILRSNPDKDPDKYTEEQVQHMRKVVSYCKRHLAQEEKTNNEKSVEEVKKTKSYASLRNWGHDVLKKRGDVDGNEGQVGAKRKKLPEAQPGANKKRETRQGKGTRNDRKDAGDEDEKEEQNDGDEDDKQEDDDRNEEEEGNATNGQDEDEEGQGEDEAEGGDGSEEPNKGPKPGDTVSWKWGGGNPEGKVLDVKDEKTTITTKRGNKVSRDGDPEDPAVVLDTGKSKAVKANHELN